MKQLMILLICVFLVIGGCQEASREKSGVDVFVEGGGEFPQFLAGAWENEKTELNYWKIVFERSGTISSAFTPVGLAEIRPNRKTEVPGPKGELGFIEAGDFSVYYKPKSRELVVNIKLEQFYLYMGEIGVLKGSWEYLFTGGISKDGRTWKVDVFSSPDVVFLVPDANSPEDKPVLKEGAKLQFGLGEEEEYPLVFTKVPDANDSPL
ncbi:MAG: hypothetical protein JW947_01865 [Sedimentisphaerales bacterium]|nr:hypothetical protein [Sedimentisphaerales bacterium]